MFGRRLTKKAGELICLHRQTLDAAIYHRSTNGLRQRLNSPTLCEKGACGEAVGLADAQAAQRQPPHRARRPTSSVPHAAARRFRSLGLDVLCSRNLAPTSQILVHLICKCGRRECSKGRAIPGERLLAFRTGHRLVDRRIQERHGCKGCSAGSENAGPTAQSEIRQPGLPASRHRG